MGIKWIVSSVICALTLLGAELAQASDFKPVYPFSDFILARPDRSSPFIDIRGVYGETEIEQLTQLGVIETTSNRFNPNAPINRGQFVAWLIQSYNALHRTPIRLATGGGSAFPDVSPTHPYFSYIQTAYEAGLIAGFDDGTFRPNQPLTREQMIALKSQLDSKGKDSRSPEKLRIYIANTQGFTDAADISDRYISYVAFDLGNAAGGRNFERVYGRTRLYKPKEAVTRAEAAILLSQFRKGQPIERVLESRPASDRRW